MESFVKSHAPDVLTQKATAALQANMHLADAVVDLLPKDKQAAMGKLFSAGASLGIEVTTDRRSRNQINLVAIDRDGVRHVLARVRAGEPTAGLQ